MLLEDIQSDVIIIDPIQEYEEIRKWNGENIGNRNDCV